MSIANLQTGIDDIIINDQIQFPGAAGVTGLIVGSSRDTSSLLCSLLGALNTVDAVAVSFYRFGRWATIQLKTGNAAVAENALDNINPIVINILLPVDMRPTSECRFSGPALFNGNIVLARYTIGIGGSLTCGSWADNHWVQGQTCGLKDVTFTYLIS